MNINLQSPRVKSTIIAVGSIAVVLVIFEAGVAVGYHRGAFSAHWRQGYMVGMNDPGSAFAPFMRDSDEPRPNGVAGSIISVNLPTFVVKGSGPEETVFVSSTTAIRLVRGQASSSDIKAGNDAIVIGSPGDDGRIDATFIRIIPRTASSTSK